MVANLDKRLEALESGAEGPSVLLVPEGSASVAIRGVRLERSLDELNEDFRERVRLFAAKSPLGRRTAVLFLNQRDERL